MACEDPAYLCMGYGADGDRLPGVFLRKNVIETAGRSLTENLARLAPLLIPASVKVALLSVAEQEALHAEACLAVLGISSRAGSA